MNLIHYTRDPSHHHPAILKALVVSLLLHGLIVVIVNLFVKDHNTLRQPLVKTQRFELINVHRDELALPAKEIKQVVSIPKKDIQRRLPQKEHAPYRSIHNDAMTVPTAPKLNLSLSEDDDLSRGRSIYGGTSSNGATIVNGQLLQRLQNTKPRGRFTERQELGPSTDNNRGFSDLSTYTQIGGKCFLVSEPKPLDTFSSEIWTRVKCR